MAKLLHVIVACAENRVIGRDGKLPWRIPEDVRFFEAQTAGNVCVLGRVCFDTWPGATREGRQPIVLTSHSLPDSTNAAAADEPRDEARRQGRSVPIPARSLTEAFAVAETIPGEICVCGGQRIFEETLTLQRPIRLHLTLVHTEVPGDRFFPEWRNLSWREISRRESADENYRYTFFTLEKSTAK
jgi:dihydrofolate reductase